MEVLKDYDLTKLNTFGVSVRAKYFTIIQNETDIAELFSLPEFKENPKLFLGGGSNVLFTHDWEGIVILNKLTGIEVLEEGDEYVLLRSMSGMVWHDLVCFTVERGLWGIENLSLIPGTVGAAPMQNIGAYGAELKNTLLNVEAYNIETREKKFFSKDECRLGYRDSVFKNELKDKYFITAITLRLSKKENKNIKYKALTEYIENNKITDLSLKNVSEAVCEIRRSKLPDPKVIGNAGSFFKNVFVDEEELRELQQSYPDIPNFREDDYIKIPAGWLIEKCGPASSGTSWKGYRVGNVGVHDKQALVLVNHGEATGEEIKDLAMQIIESVYQKFGLKLVPEVNFV